MATKTAADRLKDEVKVTGRTGGRFKGVFSEIGSSAGLNSIIGGGGKGGGTGGGAGGAGGTGGKAGGRGSFIVIKGGGDGGADALAFDKMLDEVRPGDLITSDFMVRLLERINQLEAAVLELAKGGDVTVPDFFGRSLLQVVTAVGASNGLLVFGLVLDVGGNVINPNQSGPRVVLGQHPAPGDEVDEGTELNLLVAFSNDLAAGPAGGGAGGGFAGVLGGARSEPAGELERVTDDDAQPGAAAKAAPRAASKSRKSPAK